MKRLYKDEHIFAACKQATPFELQINEALHDQCEVGNVTRFENRVIVDICTCFCHIMNGRDR